MTAPGNATQPIAGARRLLLVMSDLLFRAKIDEVARRLGLELRVAKTAEQLERQLAAGEPSLAIVDLEEHALDSFAAIARIRGAWPEAPILGYAGHANIEPIKRGREAGATVLARSGFVARLPAMLMEVAERERARQPR